ncbi:MFS transporter [Metasolibacillus sp.]|uniref:MDR family MFS transporter n=1 Tax=Metasolibacillus sp. TaxID=2703680 RepID=UPI0025D56175|nr:MFS transporter [Metasolibacillus sp.]MCT6923231.1 MFS transporter [Metasolibacillus sp.]MCT6939464.1 MFS transporter [Metasolibacillus sp.]
MKLAHYFHPLVWIILCGTIFTRIASFMTMPFLAIYLHTVHDASPLLIGFTLGVAPLCATFGGFLGGYLTDRFARKVIIIVTIFVWGMVFFGFALATFAPLFIVLNALNGLCRSFFEPATQALMIDFTEDAKKRRLFSVRYTAINIAAVIGPLVGVLISTLASPVIPFIITGAMYVIYGLFLIGVLKKYEMRQKRLAGGQNIASILRVVFSDYKLLLFLAGGTLIGLGYAQFDSTLPQFVQLKLEDGVKLYSLLISLNAVVVLILQLPISMLAERISILASLIAGIIFFALGLMLFGMANTAWLFIVAMIVFTVGEIFAFPMMNAVIEEIAPETQKATYLGASQLKNIGGFIGPVLGGWLLVHFQAQLFFIIAILVLLSIPFYRRAF